MSNDSSTSPSRELIMLYVTSAAGLVEALSALPDVTFPCAVSILHPIASTTEYESILENVSASCSTTSQLH
jgi:hypothetical protein